MSKTDLREAAVTLLIGAAGAVLAAFLSFPAPYLLGPALLLTIASFAGLKLSVPDWMRNICFVIVGITMGTSMTPEVLEAAKTWPASFLLLIPAVMLIFYAGYFVLLKTFGYDRQTAMLAASPGHLSFIISLGVDSRCDVVTVSIIQSVRVLALTLTVPFIVDYLGLVSSEPPMVLGDMALPVLAAAIVASAAIGFVFLKLKFPAALLLGGVAVSISTHVTGFVHGGVPEWITTPVYVVLGCMIGSRFSGISIMALRTAFLAGAVVTLLVTVAAAAISLFVSWLTGVPLNAVLIAFAPGGLETMAAMAVIMHVDAAYVGSHHVLRLLFLSAFMPFVTRRNRLKE